VDAINQDTQGKIALWTRDCLGRNEAPWQQSQAQVPQGPVNPRGGPNQGYWACPENLEGEGQLVTITVQVDKEPMLQVQINNRGTPMMVDTGVTYSCVSPNVASLHPHVRQICQNSRILGTNAANTAPVNLSAGLWFYSHINISIRTHSSKSIRLEVLCVRWVYKWNVPRPGANRASRHMYTNVDT
jgi:hypothetical protein